MDSRQRSLASCLVGEWDVSFLQGFPWNFKTNILTLAWKLGEDGAV